MSDDIATALKAIRAARTAQADTLRTVEREQWREEIALLDRIEASLLERRNARAMRPVWTFETFHTAECRAHLADAGARCLCRAPFAGLPPSDSTPPISGTRGGR